jgi:hypothetical protein
MTRIRERRTVFHHFFIPVEKELTALRKSGDSSKGCVPPYGTILILGRTNHRRTVKSLALGRVSLRQHHSSFCLPIRVASASSLASFPWDRMAVSANGARYYRVLYRDPLVWPQRSSVLNLTRFPISFPEVYRTHPSIRSGTLSFGHDFVPSATGRSDRPLPKTGTKS